MPVENKAFGELFAEKKNQLDHLQKDLASILPSFPGQNVAKYFDLAIGIDFHSTVFPPSPLLPVPHIGMVFDIMGAIMSVVAALMPPPPPEPEPDKDGNMPPPPPISVASVATAVVNALKPTVKVHGQWIANAGTGIQHLPGIVVHIPFPVVTPMASSEMWMGSSTVLADGGPFSTQFHPALSCNLVGFPSLFRMNKPPRPKVALMAPTSMLLTITSGGKPVMAGGPPTIDLFQLMFKMGLKGFGKLWKKASKKIGQLLPPAKTKLGQLLQNAKCRLFGEPVDAATGRVYANNIDFELPGPIPLVWERTYYSDAEVNGPLGYNWHHSYNMGLYDMGNRYFTLRLQDGREAVLPALYNGELFYNRKEQLLWQKDEQGYYLTDSSKLIYRFSDIKNKDGYQVLASISNSFGHAIQFRHSMNGLLTQIIDSSGRIIKVESDELGHILRIYTNAFGREINLIEYTYDAAGNMCKTADAGDAVKQFYYDGHLLVKLTNQSGTSFYWEYEGKGDDARCIHTWGDGGVLEYWTQYEEGKTTTRNSLGHTAVYYYDARKLVYKIIDENGGITYQSYNDFEELVTVTDPEGYNTQYHYNQYGKLVKQVNANDETSLYTYDERLNLTGITTTGNMNISWQYDDQGRVMMRKVANNNVTYYGYEGTALTTITDYKKRVFKLSYDKQHNLVQLEYPNGLKQSWDYDELGNVITATDIRQNVTRYKYDAAGSMIWMKEPDGNQHEFKYDASGNLIAAADKQHEVKFEYGPLGILLARIQNNNSVRFAYDTELRLKSIANEGGEVYRFGLDAIGNVVNEWGFDGLNRRYIRDSNGRVRKVLRPAEQWTAYDYDGMGNIVKEEHNDGSMTAYRYNKDGLLSEAFNEDIHIKLQRNKSGQVIKEVQGNYEVVKEYDEDGNCVHTTSSLGADIQNEFDADGLLKGMKSGNWELGIDRDNSGMELHRQLSGGVAVKTERDEMGRVVRRSIASKNAEQSRIRYEWGKSNKLHKIINELTQAKTNFEYDAFDNLISAEYKEGAKAETIYRVPDKIGNLFKTKDRSDRKYGKGGQLQQDEKYNYYYDAEGNLVFKEFRSNLNRNTENKRAYAQSRNIELKGSATGWAYEWQSNGMLHKVVNPGGAAVEFKYDPLGRRVAKMHKGYVTRWVWDGNVPLHEWKYKGEYPPKSIVADDGDVKEATEPDPVNSPTEVGGITWVFEEGGFVPCAKLEDEKHYSIVTDYLGTPTQGYDQSGTLIWERELDCYGTTRNLTGEQTFCNYLYQGQYVDEETGLAYNRFRYYDHESGGYISQDKLAFFGNNPTLYGYVVNTNNCIDPYGLNPEYYPLDSLGRPTGGIAEVTKSGIGSGTDAAIDPPGWQGGSHPYHQQRGHLIANNHGGSGTDPRNIVTITDGTNHPGMTKIENSITRHVNNGNTVLVEVRAHYNGDELMPSHISVFAIDQDGKVIADQSIPNGLRQKTKCCANSHH